MSGGGEQRAAGRGTGGRAGLLITLFPVLFSAVLLLATVPKLWNARFNMEPPPVGGPFHLLAAPAGRAVTERSWPGRPLLIYFGYTHCPAACPTALASMEGALDKLGPAAADVQALFITVDPHRDTPASLARYTAMFGPRIEGLTGSPRQVATAARRFRITYRAVRTGPDPDDYEMEHSSVITLMRANGGYGASFPADEDPAALARDLAAALHP